MASSARIDELRKKFDENPRRYFAPLANEYRKSGDAEQAIFICQEYLPQQPGHMSGHIVYGQALFELNRHDDARAVFETALSLDPENLIALRHLGDIARLSGDTTTARVWYQRVLEADPRNEEIAQLMMSLLSDDSAVARAANPVDETIAPTTKAEGISEAAAAEGTPASEAGMEAAEAGPRGDVYGDSLSTPSNSAPYASSPAEEARPLSPHAPKEADLLDLDDFDLGGIPLSELRAANPTPVQPFAQPFDEAAASGIELPPMIDQGAETGATPDAAPVASSEISDSLDLPAAVNDAKDEAFSVERIEAEQGEFEADPYAVASASFDNDLERSDESPAIIGGSDDSTRDTPIGATASDESLDGAFDSSFDDASADRGADAFEPGFMASAVTEAGVGAREESAEASESLDPLEPPIELATDLHLGLPNDEPSETTAPAAGMMDGLETFEAGVFSAEPPSTSFIETEPLFDITEGEALESSDASSAGDLDAADSVSPIDDSDLAVAEDTSAEISVEIGAGTVVHPPADIAAIDAGAGEEPSVAPEEAFVTETMAELYLEQGHLDAALEIYQRLVDQRPEDPALFMRMQAVQDRIEAQVGTIPVDPEAAAAVAPARSFGGPTIREFLSELARKVPGQVGAGDDAWQASQGIYPDRSGDPYAVDPYAGDDLSAYRGMPAPYDGIDEPFSSNTPHVGQAIDAPLDIPLDETLDTSVDASDDVDVSASESQPSNAGSETVGGSLGALFSGADAAAADTAAAHMLAEAFATEGPETAPLEGLPAHRAASELSLDHVFKGNSAPKPAGDADGFSFDQFFADEAVDGAAETSLDTPAPGAEGADDIAQFNAWLNGLKKT